MWVVGSGFGMCVGAAVFLMVMGLWQSRPPYQEVSRNVDSSDGESGKQRAMTAWFCLNPRCRHRNMAGAHFCGRCGATRGDTYRLDDVARESA